MTVNFTVESSFEPYAYIKRPIFASDDKKEKARIQKINSFYDEIILAAVKVSEKTGQKCYIDISADGEDVTFTVKTKIFFRHRGRITASISHVDIWKNGIIIKNNKEEIK